MKREIIAFIGRQGSGKSYQAQQLVKERDFVKLSFANPLREIAFKIIGMDFEEGMKQYDELKRTELINGLNFRNILENLGASVRKYDEDFWARALIKDIKETMGNVVIDDMRYPNEYVAVKNYCNSNNVTFRAYYCNYKSDVYDEENTHESAALSNYLARIGYNDLQLIDTKDIFSFNISVMKKKNVMSDTDSAVINPEIKSMKKASDEVLSLLKSFSK